MPDLDVALAELPHELQCELAYEVAILIEDAYRRGFEHGAAVKTDTNLARQIREWRLGTELSRTTCPPGSTQAAQPRDIFESLPRGYDERVPALSTLLAAIAVKLKGQVP